MSISPYALFRPFIISSLAALAMMAVWFTLSVRLDAALAWFSLIAAADIALLERFLRPNDRRTPIWIAPLLTLLCCLASLWLIAALSVREAGGFNMQDSTRQMGSGLFLQLTTLRLAPGDWLFIASAPFLAILLANTGGINVRRQSP